MSDTYIQALGFVAFGINILASSTVSDNRMRALICLSCLTFSLHYTLLGALVAGLNLFVNSFRAFISLKFKGTMVFWIFVLLQVALSAYFYTSPTDLLPAVASLVSCYALFCAEGLRMRIAFLICTLIWMLNAIIVGSYGGILNDMFNATMLCITIFRIKREQKPQVQAQ
ncbi:YgjV family protein [Vibrio hangzhouensis]|uniref:Inner membrane protein n=1 Tax=Vibrio hangzhouensis TaxID=462991 RepID=A0A1H5X5E0_9VIBR|nr:YgjV family protein [Vibrio hangzhouensis]SEG06486.1 inner membrane protein [Vibrio hangzhouensis]